MDYNLKPLRKSLLDIYNAFSAVCERHGLRYYGFAGTALGAVRHNGFIPWDDDLDVAMPRPDYEKFIRYAQHELPQHLKFVYWKNTPEFTQLFGKIQDVRQPVIERLEREMGVMLSCGLYIDVFPIDGYPDSSVARAVIKVRDMILKPIERFHLHRFSRLSAGGRCLWLLGAVMSLAVPWMRRQSQFMMIHEQTLQKYSFDDSSQVGDVGYWMNVLAHPPLRKEIWGTPTPHKFESQLMMLPEYVEEHLENNFGDWRMLPPEDQQHPSHQYSWRCEWWLGPTL